MKDNPRDKREFVRVEYNIPVVVETTDMAIPRFEGELQNVSAQGVMFETKEKLPIGVLVKIYLTMKKGEAPLIGQVKWQKEFGDRYRVGVVLDQSAAEQNDRVIDMVTQEIINESKRRHSPEE